MGAMPAMPKDTRSQWGRSQRGVGPGVMPHLSRVSGQRIPKPKGYQPPRDIGIERTEQWVDTTLMSAGSLRYVNHSIDIPDGETWSISLQAVVSGGSYTHTAVFGQAPGGVFGTSGPVEGGVANASAENITGPKTYSIESQARGVTSTPTSITTKARIVRIA